MLIYFISGLLNVIIIGNITLVDLVKDALLFGVLILMFAYPMDLKKGTLFFYVSISFFIIAYFTGVKAAIVLTSSSNYVSVLMILSAALYYISLYNSGEKIKLIHLFPALICFMLSIWARGRGGILTCTILLALLVLCYTINFAHSGGSIRYFVIAIIVIVALGGLYVANINPIEDYFSLGKWSNKGFNNNDREIIWAAYYEKVKESVIYIMNGAPLNDIPIIHSFNNNTHNSFIQLHANNGLVPFLIFMIFMVKSLIRYIRENKYLMAIVLFTLFIRGMTEKFIFGQYGMPIMMYLVLEPYIYLIKASKNDDNLENLIGQEERIR
ncbi:MAG: hypothetical protein IKN80_09035 [Clostridiales bacterium]|nr:hypothetical protein [Clostridiales bacterium]